MSLKGELKGNVKVHASGVLDELLKPEISSEDSLGIFIESEMEEVNGKATNRDQVEKIIELLLGKSEADFIKFCKILEKCSNDTWSTRLQKEAAKLKAALLGKLQYAALLCACDAIMFCILSFMYTVSDTQQAAKIRTAPLPPVDTPDGEAVHFYVCVACAARPKAHIMTL